MWAYFGCNDWRARARCQGNTFYVHNIFFYLFASYKPNTECWSHYSSNSVSVIGGRCELFRAIQFVSLPLSRIVLRHTPVQNTQTTSTLMTISIAYGTMFGWPRLPMQSIAASNCVRTSTSMTHDALVGCACAQTHRTKHNSALHYNNAASSNYPATISICTQSDAFVLFQTKSRMFRRAKSTQHGQRRISAQMSELPND